MEDTDCFLRWTVGDSGVDAAVTELATTFFRLGRRKGSGRITGGIRIVSSPTSSPVSISRSFFEEMPSMAAIESNHQINNQIEAVQNLARISNESQRILIKWTNKSVRVTWYVDGCIILSVNHWWLNVGFVTTQLQNDQNHFSKPIRNWPERVHQLWFNTRYLLQAAVHSPYPQALIFRPRHQLIVFIIWRQ